MVITKLFRAWLFDIRKERAIRKAKKLAKLERRKYLVLVECGKPVVVSMQTIEQQIRKKSFVKGFTADTACKLAMYIAYPGNSEPSLAHNKNV